MSLADLLTKQQFHVPESVTNNIHDEDDRMLVENICAAVQASIECANTNAARVIDTPEKYKIVVPLVGSKAVALHDMRAVMNFNPTRISDIVINIGSKADDAAGKGTAAETRPEGATVTVHVCKQSTRMPVTQLDIIRVTKRSKWF